MVDARRARTRRAAAVSVLSGVACTSSTSCFAVGGSFVSTHRQLRRADAHRAVERRRRGRSCRARTSRRDRQRARGRDVRERHELLRGRELRHPARHEHADRAVGRHDLDDRAEPEPRRARPTTSSSGVTCTSAYELLRGRHGSRHARRALERRDLVDRHEPESHGRNRRRASPASRARRASRCFAVGDHRSARHVVQRLVETWNGAGWSIVNVPVPVGHQAEQPRAACRARRATSCFAVGDFRLGPSRRPLFERYLVTVDELPVIDVSGVRSTGPGSTRSRPRSTPRAATPASSTWSVTACRRSCRRASRSSRASSSRCPTTRRRRSRCATAAERGAVGSRSAVSSRRASPT